MYVYMFVCMWVYLYVGVHLHRCRYTCMSMKKPEVVFFDCFPPYLLRQSLSLNHKLTNFLVYLASWCQGFPASHTPGLQVTTMLT